MVQNTFGLGAMDFFFFFCHNYYYQRYHLLWVGLGHSKCFLAKCLSTTYGQQVVDVHLSGVT